MSTVLIVDDTFENLYLLKVILEEAGYLVIEAKDGKEGLKQLHKHDIDLIISDILMPVMDGYMFCQACKKDDLFKDIPFVFYTSTYTEKLDEDFALKLGAVHFLRKPTDQENILKVLKDIFNGEEPKTKTTKKPQFTEEEVLKLYSKRLISKLEQKNLDLEKEVFERQKAEHLLIHENEVLDLIAVNTPIEKIFDRLLLNFQSLHPKYFGTLSLLDKDGIHLDLISAPSMPKEYGLAIKRIVIGESVGSCGTAAFRKQPVIVSDISTDALWLNYKDLAVKHGLLSCWSLPIVSKNNIVLGTFAIYSMAISTPSLEDIRELALAVNLAHVAIEKYRIVTEIKKKDESYKSLIDQASDAIVTYTLDGTIYNFNKASYTTLGYTEKEFLKLKVQDLIVGDIIDNPYTITQLQKEKPVIFDRQFRHKNGSILDVEISAKLQKEGKVVGIVRDVTEKKENLNKIKRAKEFSTGLLKSMREGLVVINLESEIISVNPAFCEMTGFTEKELLGVKRPFPYSPPELRKENDKRYAMLLKGENKGDYENTYMRKNGERFPVHVLISSIYDENGVKTANFSTVQDITQRKKAEIDLKLAKEFTDNLVMSMQEGLIIINLDVKIILVNNSTCRMLGYSNDELMSMEFPYPFIKQEDFEEIIRKREKMIRGEHNYFLFEFKRRNGETFLASFLIGNIKNDSGEVIALFATMKDVSEEEKAKKVLQDNARKSLERKNVILELANLVGTDYKSALRRITALSAETLNVRRVGVWKFNSEKNKIVCEKLFDLKDQTYGNQGLELIEKSNPNYFEALFKNKTLRIDDALKNDVTKDFAKDYLLPIGITSIMDVVIRVSDDFYGVLSFEHIGAKRKWSEDEEEFATSISNLVSLMIESSQRKIAEEELVVINKQLNNTLNEVIELKSQLEQENIYLRNELDLVFNYEEMVYGSVEFSNVLNEVEKVAPTNATVLLLGESGTGKELLARAIHNISSRNKKPLIKVNCSAIPRELLESELFGHKKGSFTGAFSDKIGKFELADGGTLFLDEIGELPLDMQPKILRFLQEGEIEVVGGAGTKKLDVRVMAATNRNLLEEIEKKQFREDLYFRLHVFPIEVPALRKRKDDIPLLVEHFVDKFNKAYEKHIKFISDEAMSQLKAYNWPGNIRELENLIERASILSTSDTLVIPGFETTNQKTKHRIDSKDVSLDSILRNHILQILEECQWKISGPKSASEMLGLKASTLRDKMAKLDIVKPEKI
ncbi:sigma 54-interacting transcriptional regulator [Bizionia arctica]|uniref:PAS domain S-box protein n=1 Tax=Bizionia arctica TaxID=1495645 RepID=A0A917GG58_9FLAO|nr:sigma 54-interacting transcriptional regulator [Bizionia arctica]GGG43909.1 hypothetical protein GCM10010976_14380 [Bizionia arctica]